MTSRVRRLLGVGGGITDQYVYAVTNFIPSVAVARSSSTSAFAMFSTVYLIYALALGASRAAIAEPLAIDSADTARTLEVRALLRSLVLAVSAGLVVVIAIGIGVQASTGLLSGIPVWAVVILLCFPFHAMQDCARALGIARHEPVRVLVSDLVWLLCGVVAFVLADGHNALDVVAVCWAGGGVVACYLVLPPRPGRVAGAGDLWSRRFSRPSLVEYSLQPAVVQGSQLLSGLAGSAAALAALRGGSVLFRPLQLMLLAHRGLVIGGRYVKEGRDTSTLRLGVSVAAAGTLVYTAVLWALPSGVGRGILGDTWPLVRSVLAPLALAQLLSLTAYAVVTDFKSRRRVEGLAVLRIPGAVVIPLTTTVGAASYGAQGAAWGLCAGQAVATAWMFLVARRPRASMPG